MTDATEITEKPYTPGGDMVEGAARAHIETAEEIAAEPIDKPVNAVSARYTFQHGKILRFEVAIGKEDDDRSIEQFEADVRRALGGHVMATGVNPPHVTMFGGYYLIDGKVCLPVDYDQATKNRKPGTFPPPWAGGPVKGKEAAYLAAQQPEESDRDEPDATDTAETAVTKLATNMARETKRRRKNA